MKTRSWRAPLDGMELAIWVREGGTTVLAPGTQSLEDAHNVMVKCMGINRREWSTVYIERPDGGVAIYRATDGKIFSYDAGKPTTVEMAFGKVVNGETLADGARHCGVMYEFKVIWEEQGDGTKNGVMITEVLTPVRADGWFAQAAERRQIIHATMDPQDVGLDMVGISESRGAFATEKPPGPSKSASSVRSAARNASGVQWIAQHFEYIDSNGTSQKIPNSGFMLIKKVEKGVLTVQRVPADVSGVKAGKADGKEYTIDIELAE